MRSLTCSVACREVVSRGSGPLTPAQPHSAHPGPHRCRVPLLRYKMNETFGQHPLWAQNSFVRLGWSQLSPKSSPESAGTWRQKVLMGDGERVLLCHQEFSEQSHLSGVVMFPSRSPCEDQSTPTYRRHENSTTLLGSSGMHAAIYSLQ